ncbi:MAG: hemolysin family protein [Bacteroidales bacterium]|jgi:CBS domain containing-hemolysin-like protein|nr:hemolysin family protein [Bacteroidales bacterium]
MDDPFLYGLLFFFTLFFSALKTAFNALNQLQLEVDKGKGNFHAKLLNFISQNFWDFSLSIVISYSIIFIVFIYFINYELSVLLQPYPLYDTLKYWTKVLVISLIIIPVIEILPQTFGKIFANKLINSLALVIFIIYLLVYPITKILTMISTLSIKLIFNDKFKKIKKQKFSIEDLNKLVNENESSNINQEEITSEIKLFKNALEFSDIKIRECMIPRTEIVAIEINDPLSLLQEKFIKTGLSKILIYRDTIDNIIGYIKSKDLFTSNGNFKKYIKNLPVFPESMQANKLLRYFIRTGQQLAIVVDEFGGTSGIITIEDILEEIFGEIKDEHDVVEHYEKQLNESNFIFSGRLEIDYINDKYGLDIPEHDEYETIAGYILYHTERIPKTNDQILIDNLKFSILKVTHTRVELIKLEIIE